MTGNKTYVLRSGRMTDAQKRSLEELSPRYLVPFQAAPPSWAAVFGREAPLVVEIGFGMGSATAQIAAANPQKNYLGLEVFKPGVGRLLWECRQRGLENVRVVNHDAVEALEAMLDDGSVSAFHIFFPDPWPKKRHHKRRLLTRAFTGLLARKLESPTAGPPGQTPYIYVVTDWPEYADWAFAELSATGGLRSLYPAFAPPQAWRPKTRFERKAEAEGRPIRELLFARTSPLSCALQ